jgi:hypothetical protein
MSFVHGTGPLGGTGAGGGTDDARGVSSGWRLSPRAVDVTACSEVAVVVEPGGVVDPEPDVGVGGAACDAASVGSPTEGRTSGAVGPSVPGCGAGAIGAAGDGEACWGADTAARLARRVVVSSPALASAPTLQASSTSTETAEATATPRRLQ